MNVIITVHMSVWTLRRYPGPGRRTGRRGATITPAVAVEVEANLSTESPGRIKNAQRMERRAGGVLGKQEGTGTEGLMEVEKQQSRTEQRMAVKGGQEETAIATKWTGRGREHASTGGSKSNLSSES